jgi:aspartokinase
LNTFNHENNGTLITSNSNASGIKTLSVLENVSLNLEEENGIVDGFFRQWIYDLSERGIGLVVAADKANRAMIELEKNLKMISILRMSIKLQLLTTFL